MNKNMKMIEALRVLNEPARDIMHKIWEAARSLPERALPEGEHWADSLEVESTVDNRIGEVTSIRWSKP